MDIQIVKQRYLIMLISGPYDEVKSPSQPELLVKFLQGIECHFLLALFGPASCSNALKVETSNP